MTALITLVKDAVLAEAKLMITRKRDTEAVPRTARPQLTLAKDVLPAEVATAGPATPIGTRKKDTEAVLPGPQLTLAKDVVPAEVAMAGPATLMIVTRKKDTEAGLPRPLRTLVKDVVLAAEVAMAGEALMITRRKDTEGVAGTKNLMMMTRKKDTEGVAEEGTARKVTIEELSVAAATGAYALHEKHKVKK